MCSESRNYLNYLVIVRFADLAPAVIVAVMFFVTVVVVTVKVAEVAPAGTVTDAGTCAEVLLLAKVTTNPAGPALPVRVTVPVEESPPFTVVGLRVKLLKLAGVTVNVLVRVTLPDFAVIVAVADAETANVVILKVALLLPLRIVTLTGTVAVLVSEEVRVTTVSTFAVEFRATVPDTTVPPSTEVLERFRVLNTTGFTVIVAPTLAPFNFAKMSEVATTVTIGVVTEKVAEVFPLSILTVAPTVAAAVLVEEILMVVSANAGALSVTVPVDFFPPITLVGFRVTEAIPGAVILKGRLWVSPPPML